MSLALAGGFLGTAPPGKPQGGVSSLTFLTYAACKEQLHLPPTGFHIAFFSPCCHRLPALVIELSPLSSKPSLLCSVWWCWVWGSVSHISALSVSSQCRLKKYVQPKIWELFYLVDKTKDLSLGHSLSASSEALLQRGNGRARMYGSFCNKNQVVGTSKYYC